MCNKPRVILLNKVHKLLASASDVNIYDTFESHILRKRKYELRETFLRVKNTPTILTFSLMRGSGGDQGVEGIR